MDKEEGEPAVEPDDEVHGCGPQGCPECYRKWEASIYTKRAVKESSTDEGC